jgi:hypothetical protein
MTNLLTWQFWFNLRPDPLLPLIQKGFIAFFVFLVVFTIAVFFIKKKSSIYKGFLKRLYNFSLSNSFIALLIIFINYELIPFFSARFWIALWGIIMIIWLLFIVKSLSKISLQKTQLEKDRELKKYLP